MEGDVPIAKWARYKELPEKKLKLMLRAGVPRHLRAEVWWYCLNATERQKQSPQTYQALSAPSDPKTEAEIELDLHRTFPQSGMLPKGSERVEQLRRVLRAFAAYCPDIRYCQGLNFVAGFCLLVFREEERAFWAMAEMLQGRMDCGGYYGPRMLQLRQDLRVFGRMLKAVRSKVKAGLDRHCSDLSWLGTQWFVTLFTNSGLSTDSVLRIWDCMVFEGWKVLFRVACGILVMRQNLIVHAKDMGELMEATKNNLGFFPPDQLLKVAFSLGTLKRRQLQAWRIDAAKEVEAEDAERDALEAKRKGAAVAETKPDGIASVQ